MNEIDRDKVRESFHRQAREYDAHAVVQRRVVERLMALLDEQQVRPQRLLDVGCGTGSLLSLLMRRYPQLSATGADLAPGMCQAAEVALAGSGAKVVNADAERLPFDDGSFDVVLSSSTYQWLDRLDTAFAEAQRVLAPRGLFLFALFGDRTLFELRESYRHALSGGCDRSLNFFSVGDVSAALERAGFERISVHSEMETEFHPDVPELLRSLKRIGAKTVPRASGKGLSERRVMLNMMEFYGREYAAPEGIPASYEVIYGVCWKAAV